jgi:hypothetical protein
MILQKFIYPTNIKSVISPVKPVLDISGGQVQDSITPANFAGRVFCFYSSRNKRLSNMTATE